MPVDYTSNMSISGLPTSQGQTGYIYVIDSFASRMQIVLTSICYNKVCHRKVLYIVSVIAMSNQTLEWSVPTLEIRVDWKGTSSTELYQVYLYIGNSGRFFWKHWIWIQPSGQWLNPFWNFTSLILVVFAESGARNLYWPLHKVPFGGWLFW